MPTARRLMNKKAFEEMELLETRCRVENDKHIKAYRPVLELQNGREVFSIYISQQGGNVPYIEMILSARNYTEIEKKFTRFVNGK